MLFFGTAAPVQAEDGYRLWLRYDPLPRNLRHSYTRHVSELVIGANGASARAATAELERGLAGLLGTPLPIRSRADRNGALVFELAGSPVLRTLHLRTKELGNEGYLIRSARLDGRWVTIVAANRETGLLYGAFALLQRMEMHQRFEHLDEVDRPVLSLRMLDHWDNLDGSIERGYAGRSIWDWHSLPGKIDQRYLDYARANASIGINGVVLNNVNADPKILTEEYLRKAAALADVFRPYGIRLFLSVRFSSPIELGALKTADPFDPAVKAWWRAKAGEIYRLIPDFGGFLVKANSEGQPGPQDYGRTHADGANLIADALAPHRGTVLWRAFVYGNLNEDRAMQAYDQFRPLDGKFRDNVIVQVKNGPIDFQPREPFHPLFGQMPHTRIAFEAQITREYLGQNTGVAYLAPLWTEALDADTCAPRCGTPVSSTIAAMAGVSNVGSDRDWTGTIFDQANWYAFGRLAWNPRLSPRQIAGDWARLTWTNDARALRPIMTMMMASREAAVDFMTPLGLAHQMATDYHYGPAPWVCNLREPAWNPCYYNGADASGIGDDRVSLPKPGTRTMGGPPNAVSEYMPPVASRFANLTTAPDKFLLWFHHLPWTYRMRSGRTLWDDLVLSYDRGIAEVSEMAGTWMSVRPFVDEQRWQEVASDLQREKVEAKWWRDASIAYFQSKSRLPLPPGTQAPAHPLSYYESLKPPHLPGQR
jgi:alpha-glucuronidase